MSIITDKTAHVLDHAVHPTLEVEVYTESGAHGSWHQSFIREQWSAELRDGDKSRYGLVLKKLLIT